MRIAPSFIKKGIVPTKKSLMEFVDQLHNTYQNFSQAFNGRISYGDGTNNENIDGSWASVTTPAPAGTSFTVTHGLQRIPVGVHVTQKNAFCDVLVVSSTKTQITLQASAAGAVIKLFIFLFFFLLLPSYSFGQGANHTNIALQTITASGSTGLSGPLLKPIAGAVITVCTGSSLPSPGSTCSPANALIYSNSALTNAISNPTNADSNGNYTFWATAGSYYVVSVSGAGLTTYSYIWSAPLITASSSASTLTGPGSISGTFSGSPSLTGTWNFSNPINGTIANATNLIGPGTISGSYTDSNAGVFTNTQMNEYFVSSLNSCSPAAEWAATQTGFATDALDGCMAVPVGATVNGAYGVVGFANSKSTTSNVAGGYFQARALANNTVIWGDNPIAIIPNGFTGVKITGEEVDCTNSSGVDATPGQALVQDCLNLIGGGTNKLRFGFRVGGGGAGVFQTGGLIQNFHTGGLLINGYDVGAWAESITPPDNTSANEIFGTNAANSTILWFIQNVGTAQHEILGLVNWLTDNSGCNTAASGFERLCNTDHIGWRDAANGSDHLLGEVQHIRGVAGCTTGAGLNNTCTTLITWPTPFADTNYTVIGCEGKSTFTGTPVLQGEVAASRLAASITVQTINLSAVASSFAAIDCAATHD